MSLSPSPKAPSQQSLPRRMTAVETWGFGLSGHISWFSTLPLLTVALGANSFTVLIPAVLVGMAINFQVKRLGERWVGVAGGTPNYVTRLLKSYPGLGRYAAIGYWIAWVSTIPLNAIVFTDLIQSSIAPLKLDSFRFGLQLVLTVLPYLLAFSGTRSLAILHLFFVVPAVGLSLIFCAQGLSWLAFSPDSPGLFVFTHQPAAAFSLFDWAKWMFFALWVTTACETTASFVADSQNPRQTLNFLKIAAWLILPVTLGISWVLVNLTSAAPANASVFELVRIAAVPFWGQGASLGVTLMLACACLLNNATAVANTPRILYQLSCDRLIAPIFSVISREGVLKPALWAGLVVSLGFSVWGDLARIVVIAGTGWLASFLGLFFGLWLQRRTPAVLWSTWWLVWTCIIGFVIAIGGWFWGRQDLLIGLTLPALVLLADRILVSLPTFSIRLPFLSILPKSVQRIRVIQSKHHDFFMIQVIILLLLVCGATVVGWTMKSWLVSLSIYRNDLFAVLLILIAFIAITIAGWTSLPQILAIDEARERAESLFIAAFDTVPDTILVVDQEGVIQQTNTSVESLFQEPLQHLLGRYLWELIPTLSQVPSQWISKSEHDVRVGSSYKAQTQSIEATVSIRSNHQRQEYIVILRNITERKRTEQTLRQSESAFRQQAKELHQALEQLQQAQSQLIQTEKMSSLGQMTAGIAHEINNPVNFIHGNVDYIVNYVKGLLSLVSAYRQQYPQPGDKIEAQIEDIDLDFLLNDFPKLMHSLQEGTRRIKEIVLGLRNFSRLDEAESKLVNIHEGLENTLLILQHRLRPYPNHCHIQVVKSYGDLPLVECYPGQLNQVFMNLLANAIDAIEDRIAKASQNDGFQGLITISTSFDKSDQARISIADNGSGISPSAVEKLFDPFFTTKPIGKGTGLGLSISYQIISQHHGALSCNSTPGEGTEFVCIIPVKLQKLNCSFNESRSEC